MKANENTPSRKWHADDYRPNSHTAGGTNRSALCHPRLSDDEFPAFVLLFVLMHARVCHLEDSMMVAPKFIVSAIGLQQDQWPVVIKHQPLRLEWDSEVPEDVLDAWHTTFGERGFNEIRRHVEPVSMYRKFDKAVTYLPNARVD